MKLVIASIFVLLSGLVNMAFSANSITGVWKSIDDKSKSAKSLVRISIKNGLAVGRVIKIIEKKHGPNPICTPCKGRYKNKPVLGMIVLRGFNADANGVWTGGNILDPENGKVYKARLRVLANGKKLELRGYLGPFYRTQIWRAQ